MVQVARGSEAGPALGVRQRIRGDGKAGDGVEVELHGGASVVRCGIVFRNIVVYYE